MLNRVFYLLFIFAQGMSLSFASSDPYSARNEIFDNPYFVVGINKKENILSGYVSALRTAPGESNECKLLFKGRIEKGASFPIEVIDASRHSKKIKPLPANLFRVGNGYKIVIKKNDLPGDCDWVLTYVGAPSVQTEGDEFKLLINVDDRGDWQGVNVISSKRAFFHSSPEVAYKQKTYLVEGYLIYFFDEAPEWYFVKYKSQKKIISGWINKSDTRGQ